MTLHERGRRPPEYLETGGARHLGELQPFEDRQGFTASDVARIKSLGHDYEVIVPRWNKEYGREISEDFRRLTISLALFIGGRPEKFALASQFYAYYAQHSLKKSQDRTLHNWTTIADAKGDFYRDRGGSDTGAGYATSKQNLLYFTSWQKARLLKACSNAPLTPRSIVADRTGRRLSTMEK